MARSDKDIGEHQKTPTVSRVSGCKGHRIWTAPSYVNIGVFVSLAQGTHLFLVHSWYERHRPFAYGRLTQSGMRRLLRTSVKGSGCTDVINFTSPRGGIFGPRQNHSTIRQLSKLEHISIHPSYAWTNDTGICAASKLLGPSFQRRCVTQGFSELWEWW